MACTSCSMFTSWRSRNDRPDMMRVWAIIVLGIVLGACWTAPATPPPAAPEPVPETQPPVAFREGRRHSPCEATAEHVLDVLHDEIDRLPPELVDKLPQILIDSCTATSWSDDTLRCFNDSGDSQAVQRCQSQLTPDQSSDMMRRVSEAFANSKTPP